MKIHNTQKRQGRNSSRPFNCSHCAMIAHKTTLICLLQDVDIKRTLPRSYLAGMCWLLWLCWIKRGTKHSIFSGDGVRVETYVRRWRVWTTRQRHMILWWRIDRWIFAVHSLSRFPWWVFVPRYIVMRKLQCNFVPVFVKLVFFLHFFSFLQSARQQRIQFFNLTRHWLKTRYKQVNEPLTTWVTLIIFPEVVHIPLGPVIWVEWAHEDEISIYYFSIRFIGRII